VQGATCTISTVNPVASLSDGTTGFTTITHTPVAGPLGATYDAVAATLVNSGQAGAMGKIAYTVDTQPHALRTQSLLPRQGP
jgi:hypothetical protein